MSYTLESKRRKLREKLPNYAVSWWAKTTHQCLLASAQNQNCKQHSRRRAYAMFSVFVSRRWKKEPTAMFNLHPCNCMLAIEGEIFRCSADCGRIKKKRIKIKFTPCFLFLTQLKAEFYILPAASTPDWLPWEFSILQSSIQNTE